MTRTGDATRSTEDGDMNDPQSGWRSRLVGYAAAAGLALAAVLVRSALDPILEDRQPRIAFHLAVLASAWWFGFGPAALAMAIGYVASRYLFVEPRHTLSFASWQHVLSAATFVISGGVVAALVATLRHSLLTLRAQNQQLLHKQQLLDSESDQRRSVERHLRQTKSQLRLSDEEFRMLASSAPVGIFRLDPDGACTFVSDSCCRIAGLAPAETLGHAWTQLVHSEDLRRLLRRWRRAIRGPDTFVSEVRLTPASGTMMTLFAVVQPVRDELHVIDHYVGTLIDMTNLRAVSTQLEHKERVLSRLLEVQEQERQSLCHEFHDGLIQYAIASKMLLEGLQQRLPPHFATVLDAVVTCLRDGIEDGRRVIRGIRSSVLDDLGLAAAIDDLIEHGLGDAVTVVRKVDDEIDALPSSTQTTIYRVIQESLHNVRKHSGSPRAVVDLRIVAGLVELSVQDFGCGFDVDAGRRQGCGLLGMSERVRLAGGQCRVESRPGEGTRVAVTMPAEFATVGLPGDGAPELSMPVAWLPSRDVAGIGSSASPLTVATPR
jgi:PAS domain S-box-containing protein